jgi:hypothetical protein
MGVRVHLLAVPILLSLTGPASAAAAAATGVGGHCPPAHLPAARPLPATARAVADRRPVLLLAVGSALQAVHVGPAQTFPALTVELLRHAMSLPVELLLRDDPGATAADMVPALRRALTDRRATLVLWQTGTVDAARHVPPAAFGAALAEGVRLTQASGADLVLIDPLYSRLLQDRADLAPYEAQLAQAAQSSGVGLFRRNALVRQWVAGGALDMEAVPASGRARTLVALHDCLAAALAQQILAGANTDQPSSQADDNN